MRTLPAGETPRANETAVTLKNATARLLHVGVGGGVFATIPPTVGEASVTLALLTKEKQGWDKALLTPTVAAWTAAGQLVVVPPPEPPPEGPVS